MTAVLTHEIDISKGSLHINTDNVYQNELWVADKVSDAVMNLVKIGNIMQWNGTQYRFFFRDNAWKLHIWSRIPNPKIH